uniref:Galectin n=1 Tax=Glossina brevipalpis TaxID=37001 RepID=A0A1A9WDL6_9MUSC
MNLWKGKVLTNLPYGHVLIIGGRIKSNPYKINLDVSSLDEKLTLDNEKGMFLKVEVNFRENSAIHSIFQPGEPGKQQEEIWKTEGPKNPLLPGQNFIFRIALLQKCFEIYVNDHIYGTFEFQQPPKQIQYVTLQGDFEKVTQFHQRMLFPIAFPKTLLSCEKIAFQSDVAKKYETGTVVALECIAKGPPLTEFSICFQCNDTGRIILKFLVNFDKCCVTRSCQKEDNSFSPDDEETDGEFPFQRGKLFKIAFGIGEKAFIIAVNGQYFTYFNYPYRSFAISALKCCTNDVGDLTVKSLEYHLEPSLELLRCHYII